MIVWSSDGEAYLDCLWRVLEIISVALTDDEGSAPEDAAIGSTDSGNGKGASAHARRGKRGDLTPLQSCLISIVSKTQPSVTDADDEGADDDDDGDNDDGIYADGDDKLSDRMIWKLADGLLKQSMSTVQTTEETVGM